jgi:hypothetical protein
MFWWLAFQLACLGGFLILVGDPPELPWHD